MRAYNGISLNHLDPTDPAFVDSLRTALNQINLWILAAQRELSPTQGGSVAAEGASVDEPYVVATATTGLNNERVLAGVSPIGVSDGGAGGNISVVLTGTVPVANGGTGASTATAARANLDAEAITVNGVAVVDADLDDATPAAPAGGVNVKWQKDSSSPANISAYAPSASPTSMTFGSTSADGSAASFVRTDARLPVFDGTNPETLAPDTVSSGSAGKAARRDHAHGIVTAAPSLVFGDTDDDGLANAVMRPDCSVKSKTSAHWLCTTANKGIACKDTQATARYWAIYAEKGATGPTGDATINIDSAGAITASRAGGATGDITIVIKDLGTSLPF